MTDRNGGDYIYDTLSNAAGVTAIVLAGNIFEARLIPKSCTAYDTINYYMIDPVLGGQVYFQTKWSIDCRSQSESTAREIAYQVSLALNREFRDVGGKTYYGVADTLGSIPPINDEDCYNVPVELIIRRK